MEIIKQAVVQLLLTIALLENDAAEAKRIVEGFTPMFATKEDYFDYVDALGCAGDRIEYTEDSATIKL